MLPSFEMRVWEAEEDLGKLTFSEEVGEELHRVGPETGDILVTTSARILIPQCFDAVLNELCDFSSDFHTYASVSENS